MAIKQCHLLGSPVVDEVLVCMGETGHGAPPVVTKIDAGHNGPHVVHGK